MVTDSFNVYLKTDDIYKNIAEDVKTRFDTSNHELEWNFIDKVLLKGKNKKLIGLMRDQLRGKIITKFAWLRAKQMTVVKIKKGKGTKKCVIKRKLKF